VTGVDAKANGPRGQGQGQSHDFRPRAVVNVEDSPQGPRPW